MVLEIGIEGTKNGMLVVMDWLDVALIIVVMVKLRMHVLSHLMLVWVVVLGKNMRNDFVLIGGFLRVVMRFLVSISEIISMAKGTMDGMLVEVDGLDVVLVIEMVVKLMMSLVVDDVVVSLMLVSRVVVSRLAVSD